MEETDPWYEEKLQQIDSLESQLKKIFTIVDNLQGMHRDLDNLNLVKLGCSGFVLA